MVKQSKKIQDDKSYVESTKTSELSSTTVNEEEVLDNKDADAFNDIMKGFDNKDAESQQKPAVKQSKKQQEQQEQLDKYNEKYGNNWYIKHKDLLEKYLQPIDEKDLKETPSNVVEDEFTQCLVKYRKFKKIGELSDFEKEFINKGTRSDKVATIVEVLKRDPLPHLDLLDKLLHECQHAHSDLAVAAARELFLDVLIPQEPPAVKVVGGLEYKVAPFSQLVPKFLKSKKSDGKSGSSEVDDYVIMYTCDILYKRYNGFLDILESLSKSKSASAVRRDSVKVMSPLMNIKTSQQKLVRILVQTMGDDDGHIGEMSMKTISYYLKAGTANCRNELIRELVLFLYNSKIAPSRRKNAAILLADHRYERILDQPLARHVNNAFVRLIKSNVKKTDKAGKSDKKANKKAEKKKAKQQLFMDSDGALLTRALIGFWKTYRVSSERRMLTDEEKGTEPEEQLDWKSLADIARNGQFNMAFEACRALWVVALMNDSTTVIADTLCQIVYNKLADAALLPSSKLSAFLLLVLNMMTHDPNVQRVYAFAKRLVHTCLHGTTAYSCALLLSVADAMKAVPAIKTLLTSNTMYDDGEDDDVDMAEANKNAYDIRAAEPRKANAGKTSLWELSLLHDHYCPTTKALSDHFIESKEISYNGNPFHDFRMVKFLDEIILDPKRMKKALEKQIKQQKFQNKRSPFATDIRTVEVPKTYTEMFKLRQDMPEHQQFLKRFTQYKNEIATKTKEARDKEKTTADKKKDKKKKKILESAKSAQHMEDDEEETEYKYEDLADAIDEDGIEESKLDEMLMRLGDNEDDADAVEEMLEGDDAQERADRDILDAQAEMSHLLDKAGAEDDEDDKKKGNKKKNSKFSDNNNNNRRDKPKGISKPKRMNKKIQKKR